MSLENSFVIVFGMLQFKVVGVKAMMLVIKVVVVVILVVEIVVVVVEVVVVRIVIKKCSNIFLQ